MCSECDVEHIEARNTWDLNTRVEVSGRAVDTSDEKQKAVWTVGPFRGLAAPLARDSARAMIMASWSTWFSPARNLNQAGNRGGY